MTLLQRVGLASVLSMFGVAFFPVHLGGAEIATANLEIRGAGLRVVTISATTGLDIPVSIQTEFGGKQNELATIVPGLTAVGELTGPGLNEPIRLETTPGHRFSIPGLSREGIYYLQNIRMMKGSELLQPATPSLATITVANLLQTSVRVRQLSPEELRARGISIDARNFDVFEYTFTFIIDGRTVEIPFPVIIDPVTRAIRPVVSETPFTLPPVSTIKPPRWTPPTIIATELVEEGPDLPALPPEQLVQERAARRPSIPAAIVIPNDLAVLHQFFAVALMVQNGAPAGSNVRLDSVAATIKLPPSLRASRTNPVVGFGQPVPFHDPVTGATFLIAGAKAEAEWTLEGLKAGTHTLEFDLRATFQSPGQADVPMKATPRATVVVHDPRFNITFSHPETVRKGIDYSTFTFITNMSPVAQTIRLANRVASCEQSPGANVCRLSGAESDELTIPAGEMRSVEYRLRPGITGQVFATAGSVEGENLSAAVQLTMGVSESGIPLSPATLLLPHYAQFVDQRLVAPYLQLLGLGYSLATAPLNAMTAKFPRVIRTDVFQRAVDIGRAGQQIFISDPSPEAKRDTIANLTLDLLGNGTDLGEWDELRRKEKSGRTAGAAVVRELERTGLTADITPAAFVDTFAAATVHRTPFALALVHGPVVTGDPRPWALSLKTPAGARSDIPNEATTGWLRDVPYTDVSSLELTSRNIAGEIALAGRWIDGLELTLTPKAAGALTLELIFPGTTDGSAMRATLTVTATANAPLRVTLVRGMTTVNLLGANGGIVATTTARPVALPPLRVVKARQDLYLDREAHKVSTLFNRPIGVAAGTNLKEKFTGRIVFDRDGVQFDGPRPISSAILQAGGQVVNLTFDHALSTNAAYTVRLSDVLDPATGAAVTFPDPITPRIDNDRPAGIIYGRVLKGDNSAIPGAEVTLQSGAPQYDLSRASDGAYLFEYVPRDIDNGFPGAYRLAAVTPDGKQTAVTGSVRLPGKVHIVNLQFLGRGSAEGTVRYDNGAKVAGARVVIGSTLFSQFRQTTANSDGKFSVTDLPVGPLTFSATDEAGNIAFAAGEIRTPGQLLVQDLSIYRKPFPGNGTVRGVVTRSDTSQPVAFAHVGVYSQGYGLSDAFTDAQGRFEFEKVPSGFVTVLASEFAISRESVSVDLDLRSDEAKELALILSVRPAESTVTVSGTVTRENPLFPGDASKYEKVAGALVKIDHGQLVTADSLGRFTIDGVPLSWSGRSIRAHDPLTARAGSASLPTLSTTAPNNVAIFMRASDGFGIGTIRVRLVDASGSAVDGYRVVEPGFPPALFEPLGGGRYELKNVAAGRSMSVWAVPAAPRASTDAAVADTRRYGDQFASGSAKVEFNGHTASLALRLPGEGLVRTDVRSDIALITPVTIRYTVWDESDQSTSPLELTGTTAQNGAAGFASFTKVPALSGFTVASAHPVHGYASKGAQLGFDGDVATLTLQLNRLSTVRGTVYAIDGRTPVAGASVRIHDGRQDQGTSATLPDGTFEFRNVAANVSFSVIAEITQSGGFRTGIVTGSTPAVGGPVDGLELILRRRGNVEGRVVYAGYKKFDAANPANNIIDDTPNDPSDNAPVPLARFSLRELDFPFRFFGTSSDPLTADLGGRFSVPNLFVGPLRGTASDPGNQEIRGDWTDSLTAEGSTLTAYVAIGSGGFGPVVVTVVDPNSGATVTNAEVSLYQGARVFDFGSTDSSGTIQFQGVPAGSWSAGAFSKALGKSGSSGTITVLANTGGSGRIVLELSGKVDGKLTDRQDGGKGIAGAHVTLTAAAYQSRATTATTGLFTFGGVREGTFQLAAKDTESNRRAAAQGTLNATNPSPVVDLELEPVESLRVSVFLPNDTGGKSATPAPPLDIEVTQRCSGGGCDYIRSLQGNNLTFPGLFRNEPYVVVAKEIGGEGRRITTSRSFPTGSAAAPLELVFQAYGGIDVQVTQAGNPAASSRVTVSGGGVSGTVYTDAAGRATLRGVPLGDVSVQAVSVDNAFSGSITSKIESQSIAPLVTVELGAYAGLSGYVEAEAGGPSAGTRVVASFGRVLEMLTSSDGRYVLQGIPTSAAGTSVNLTFIGPDGVTVGARQSALVANSAASRVIELPAVKLDATSPQILSIVPVDGSANVSPDAAVTVTFSEPVQSAQLTSAFFTLTPAGSSQVVQTAFSTSSSADGKFIVRMFPPPPPAGQRFPLESNTLYRIVISGGIQDLTGNTIPAPRGATFTTSDYAEPRVLKVLPPPSLPLLRATTFEFRFNEPVDPAPWQSGGTGRFLFQKLTAAGGTVSAVKSGRVFLDPTGFFLFFAPDEAIAPESFYRTVLSGVKDLQGNALPEQSFDFFSFDEKKPFVILTSPVPAGSSLVSGLDYTLAPDLRNETATGTPATDIATVDYFRVDGTSETFLFSAKTAPFSYRFVAPEAPVGGITLKLRATARDLSGNTSEKTDISWEVKPNRAPQNIRAVLTPAAGAYPGGRVNVGVAFEDEGTFATVAVKLEAAKAGGATHTEAKSLEQRRSSLSVAWPATSFDFDLPVTLTTGVDSIFTVTVSDLLLSDAVTARLPLRVDTEPPVVTRLTPGADQLFEEGTNQTITVTAIAVDAEVAVLKAWLQLDDATAVELDRDPATPNGFRKVIPVPTVEGSAIVTKQLKVFADDYAGNRGSATAIPIRIKPLLDPNAPLISWSCSTPGAMYPAGYPAKIRVVAKGANSLNGVQKVELVVSETQTIAMTAVSGLADHFEATVTIPQLADGAKLPLKAIAIATSGIRSELRQELTVVAGTVITSGRTVSASTVRADETIILYSLAPAPPITVAFDGATSFRRLVVLDGATVTQVPTSSSTIRRLELRGLEAVYVSCASAIDVSGRGFAETVNGVGYTWPNGTTGGSEHWSGGSHGGRGGLYSEGVAGVAYGSLDDPDTPGGAGAVGRGSNCAGCYAGGGVARFEAESLVLDGKIVATGSVEGPGQYASGAGGSIRIKVGSLSGGGEIRADGGGKEGDNRAGGGGRVAVYYETRTLDRARITAAGGGGSVPGSAGTVYLQQTSATGAKLNDELVIDNRDRSSSQVTRLASTGSGTVKSVTGAVVELSGAVPEWVEGSWIEFLDALGGVISSYEIAARSATSVTVKLPAVETAANASVGNGYRNTWRFGNVTAQGRGVLESDGVRAPGMSTSGSGVLRLVYAGADDLTFTGPGTIELNGTLEAKNLRLRSGAVISHSPTTRQTIHRLNLKIAETLAIDGSSAIDVSGRGFSETVNGVGYTWPNGTTGASEHWSGGSHGGRGGLYSEGVAGVAYGSVYDPNTPGGSGARGRGSSCAGCYAGGGVARVKAKRLVLDGKIVANGSVDGPGQYASGAGGSIRIEVGSLSGGGEIRADGGGHEGDNRAGGGGRVALYYETRTLDRARISAAGGGGSVPGSAGTVYLQQTSATGAKLNDELVIDNRDRSSSQVTRLASTGSGTVKSVTGAVVELSGAVPEWVEGSWIEFLDALGTVISSYEIAARSATSVTVKLPAVETAANASVGNGYRNTWRFGNVTAQGRGVLESDGVRAPGMSTSGSGVLRLVYAGADDLTFTGPGTIELNGTLEAKNLRLQSGAVISHSPTTRQTIHRLNLKIAETLAIDGTSAIDVSGRGFSETVNGVGYTWPNGTTGGSEHWSGGSHGGRGGLYSEGVAGVAYGSLFDPNAPGGAGARGRTYNCEGCYAGGGVARVKAKSLVLDGKIVANGSVDGPGQYASGAGGSIRIEVASLSGGGEIRADGGGKEGDNRAGGGGRVAVHYETLALDRARITAAGGPRNNPVERGAAGTVYLKASGQTNGELIVDNGSGTLATAVSSLPSIGTVARVTSVGATASGGPTDYVEDSTAAFPVADQLRGARLFLNGDPSVSWPILGNSEKRVTVSPGPTFFPVVGQTFRGLYRFDSITLKNATLQVSDLLEGPVTKDAGSKIISSVSSVASMTSTDAPTTASSSVALVAMIVPGSMGAGSVASGKLLLAGPAPAGGALVLLRSSNPSMFSVPFQVAIPEGERSGSFPISASPMAVALSADITATSGNTVGIAITGIGPSNQSPREGGR